jgi:hypothetical protein
MKTIYEKLQIINILIEESYLPNRRDPGAGPDINSEDLNNLYAIRESLNEELHGYQGFLPIHEDSKGPDTGYTFRKVVPQSLTITDSGDGNYLQISFVEEE